MHSPGDSPWFRLLFIQVLERGNIYTQSSNMDQEEFNDLCKHHGFSGATPGALAIYNTMLKEWSEHLMESLGPEPLVTRHSFERLQKQQRGGDYTQASEYYGIDSGRFSPGHEQYGGGAPNKMFHLSQAAVNKLLKPSGKRFSVSAMSISKDVLSVVSFHVLSKLAKDRVGKPLDSKTLRSIHI